jgi:hypothetical protein
VGVGDGGAGGDLPPARIYSAGVASASRRRVVAASRPGLVLRKGVRMTGPGCGRAAA